MDDAAVDHRRAEQLFAMLYQELHAIAVRRLRQRNGTAWSATTLLHEAFIRLSGCAITFENQAHFIGYAARTMRTLLIDQRRARAACKRGGEYQITALPLEMPHAELPDQELERLNEAIETLAALDARLARTIELRFLCGFSFEDVANLLEVSERTVRRDWVNARASISVAQRCQRHGRQRSPGATLRGD